MRNPFHRLQDELIDEQSLAEVDSKKLILWQLNRIAESLQSDGVVPEIFLENQELDLRALLLDLDRAVLHKVWVLYVYQDGLHMLDDRERLIVIE